MLIDTHVHSTASDGNKTVSEIFSLAKDRQVRLLVITDHDTLGAYPEAFEEAREHGIKTLGGLELTAKDRSVPKNVHVVGLNVDINNADLQEHLDMMRKSRNSSRKCTLDKLNRFFESRFGRWEPVAFEEIEKAVPGGIVGKRHIQSAMMSKAAELGFHLSEPEFNHAYSDFRPGGLYAPQLTDCIELIRAAGGIPILAHPCQYPAVPDIVKKFAGAGGEAIELSRYSYKHMRCMPEDAASRMATERELNLAALGLARRYGLRLTLASDYHGHGQPGLDTGEYDVDLRWLFDIAPIIR